MFLKDFSMLTYANCYIVVRTFVNMLILSLCEEEIFYYYYYFIYSLLLHTQKKHLSMNFWLLNIKKEKNSYSRKQNMYLFLCITSLYVITEQTNHFILSYRK